MKRRVLPWLLTLGLVLAPVVAALTAPAVGPGQVVLLDIKGGIGPATRDYLQRGLRKAAQEGAGAVILRIDTPGGLDAATRDINQAILASQVPVIGWVAPQGARAASAGTYILYACHVAAMAPATSVGAATPVSVGGAGGFPGRAPKRQSPAESGKPGTAPVADGPPPKPDGADGQDEGGSAMEHKVVNDSVAYLRGLAELRHRDVEFAEAAVREAATLTASQALSKHVIDIVAADLGALLKQANGREVALASGVVRLQLDPDPAAVRILVPGWRARLLGVLTDPTVAYLLLLAGLYALVIEAYTPGALFPGVTGAICLLLALYALQVLPVNYAGVALIVLGVALMAAEFALPSFGSLGIGGIVALVVGSLILFDTDVPGFGVPGRLVMGIAAASTVGFMGVIWLAARARRRPVVTGVEELIGQTVAALDDFDETAGGAGSRLNGGHVRIRGEVWTALSAQPVEAGQAVRVLAVEGLVLRVAPVERGGATS